MDYLEISLQSSRDPSTENNRKRGTSCSYTMVAWYIVPYTLLQPFHSLCLFHSPACRVFTLRDQGTCMHATVTAIGVQKRALSLSLSLSLERARARWPSCHYPRPFAPAGTFSSISVRVIIAVSVPGDARICSTLRCSGMRHAILVDAYVATLNLDSSAPCLVEYVVGPLGHARHRF